MLGTKKFQRTTEDFECEKCGHFMKGNGYTNHCEQCLWSKHVDINPGDRQENCQGLMQPVGLSVKGDEYIIKHRCVRCGFEKTNKTTATDNFEQILKISTQVD